VCVCVCVYECAGIYILELLFNLQHVKKTGHVCVYVYNYCISSTFRV